MGSAHSSTSVTQTLVGTVADTVTIDQVWSTISITNHDASHTLWYRQDGTTTPAAAVASGLGCIPVSPLQTLSVASIPTPDNTVVISVVGNGGQYTVEGVNPFIDDGVDVVGAGRVVTTAAYCDMTGATDSAPGLRQAYADAVTLGLPLYISEGTILLDSVDANNNFVTMTDPVTIFGEFGRSVIQIGPTINWSHVFGPASDLLQTDLSDTEIYGVIWDGNVLNNATALTALSHRDAFCTYLGSSIRIHDNIVRNWSGRNVFTVDSRITDSTNIWITNNSFRNIGSSTYWHDHSTIYTDSYGTHILDNNFTGTSSMPSSATCAIEAHGGAQDVRGNVITNYWSMGNACAPGPTYNANGPSYGYVWRDNIGINVGCGIQLWPLTPMLGGIDFQNEIHIGIDDWPTVAAGNPNFPAFEHFGIAAHFTAAASCINGATFRDTIVYMPHNTAAGVPDYVTSWIRDSAVCPTAADTRIHLDQKVYNAPSTCLLIQSYYKLIDWKITSTFYNVGKQGLGSDAQKGTIIRNCVGPIGEVGISSFRQAATWIDDTAGHTLITPLHLQPGTSRTASATTTNTSTTVACTAAIATDKNSSITGTGIPASTTIVSVTPGVGYVISQAATASGTITATITGTTPSVLGVETTGSRILMADGAVLTSSIYQSNQRVDDAFDSWAVELNPFHTPLAVVGVGWGVAGDTGSIMSGYFTNALTGPAQDDSADFDAPFIPAGTYTFEALGLKRANCGIVTVQLDNGAGTFTTIGTWDFYAASDTYNSLVSFSATITATIPKRRIRFLMATKNGSATGYRVYLNHVRAWRTA